MEEREYPCSNVDNLLREVYVWRRPVKRKIAIRKKRKVRRIVFTAVNIAIPLTILLYLWTYSAEKDAHCVPDYPMEDITSYLTKEILSPEEYELLFRQTGMTKPGIDALRREKRSYELLRVQQRFFRDVEVECERSFLLFREMLKERSVEIERQLVPTGQWTNSEGENTGKLRARNLEKEVLEGNNRFLPVLEDGDILITFNSHFLGWRNGHAALVIDAENSLTLEAITLGEDSTIMSVESWAKRPSFVLLRLAGATKEVRSEIAEYARTTLNKQPYRLTAGLWKEKGELVGTHCAHLIWYAYHQFGYNLDSDGGMLVTPKDIYDSPLLEVIQVYGVNMKF